MKVFNSSNLHSLPLIFIALGINFQVMCFVHNLSNKLQIESSNYRCAAFLYLLINSVLLRLTCPSERPCNLAQLKPSALKTFILCILWMPKQSHFGNIHIPAVASSGDNARADTCRENNHLHRFFSQQPHSALRSKHR